MKKLKFNSNFIKNSSKKEYKKILKIVNSLLNTRMNDKPRDYLMRMFSKKYGETNHKMLKLPGIFNETEDTAGFTSTGRYVYFDRLIRILPDGDNIPEEIIGILEFLTSKIDDEKIESLYNCSSAVIREYGLNFLIFVVTNYNEGVLQKTYNYKSMNVPINFIHIGKKEQYKNLNTLNKKDYSRYKMTEEEFYTLILSLSFVKKTYAKDFIEKSVRLYVTIENIDIEHQKDLCIELTLLIKHYFKDEPKKLRRLLIMVIKASSDTTIDNIENDNWLLNDNVQLNNDNAYLTNQNVQLNNEVSRLNDELSKNKELMAEMTERIKQLEEKDSNN